MILLVHLAEHQFHLLTVLGHEVSLSLYQFTSAATNIVDFLCRQLGHLGRAARSENLLVHKLAGIDGSWLCDRLEGYERLLRMRLGIDSQ